MNINQKKSEMYLEKNKKKLINYIKKRKIISKSYLKFIRNTGGGFLEPNLIYIKGEEFSLDVFLGSSKTNVFDLVETNNLLNFKSGKIVAIASLIGDDFICIKEMDEAIYYCSLDDIEEKSLIKIANDFDEFLNLIN